MSKQFIDDLLDECHQKIIEGEVYGVVEALKTIKIRVHNQQVIDKIKSFENTADTKYDFRLSENEKRGMNSNDTARANNTEYVKLVHEYLSFYDRLSKEYEIC